jgi:hypothetical protein
MTLLRSVTALAVAALHLLAVAALHLLAVAALHLVALLPCLLDWDVLLRLFALSPATLLVM